MNNDSYNLNNYFRHESDMLALVTHPDVDTVLKELLNPDYVMVNSNLINRFRKNVEQQVSQEEVKHAGHWHSDSRYLGGKRISEGFSYIGIIMLEAFGKDNGATHYIPGSQSNTSFPERYADYKHEIMEGDAGTFVLFDSALWHRGGIASNQRTRWSVYTIYGGAFYKPFFWFPAMMGEEFGKNATPELKRLFHYDSIPPTNEGI